LHKLLVDTGKASSVEGVPEPASEEYLATLNITLAPNQSHDEIESLVLQTIKDSPVAEITPLIKKVKAQILTDELFARTQSLRIAEELTEYVSSGQWEKYGETVEILKAITSKQVHQLLQQSFISNNLTIGHFIGKN